MQTDNLFSLELKRNNLRPYQIAAVISNFFILGFIYLMAAIPKIDPGDSDVELFSSYKFVIGLSFVVMMGIFSIISATMASRFIVDEYSGKKAILLLSYPISHYYGYNVSDNSYDIFFRSSYDDISFRNVSAYIVSC